MSLVLHPPSAPRPRIVHTLPGLGLGGAECMLLTWLEHSAALVDNEVWALRGGELEAPMRAASARVTVVGEVMASHPARGRLDDSRGFAHPPPPSPAAVMGWLHHGNAWAAGLQRLRWPRARLVMSHHGGPDAPPGPWHRRMAQHVERRTRALAHAHLYVAACSARAARLQGASLRRAWRLPAGIDTQAFAPSPAAATTLRASLGLPLCARLTGLVGRYDAAKDHALGLRAFWHGAQPHDHLLLVGTGLHPLPAELTALCSAQQRGRVHTRVASPAQMPGIVAGLDALLLSSRSEALPLAVLEAMACARPVAATAVGDVAEILSPCGFVAPWNDVAGLSAALRRALAQGYAAAHAPNAAAAARLRAGRDWVARKHGVHGLVALLHGQLCP